MKASTLQASQTPRAPAHSQHQPQVFPKYFCHAGLFVSNQVLSNCHAFFTVVSTTVSVPLPNGDWQHWMIIAFVSRSETRRPNAPSPSTCSPRLWEGKSLLNMAHAPWLRASFRRFSSPHLTIDDGPVPLLQIDFLPKGYWSWNDWPPLLLLKRLLEPLPP